MTNSDAHYREELETYRARVRAMRAEEERQAVEPADVVTVADVIVHVAPGGHVLPLHDHGRLIGVIVHPSDLRKLGVTVRPRPGASRRSGLTG